MIFIIVILIFVACVILLNRSGNKKEILRKYNMYILKGTEYLGAGNVEKASELYDKAIEINPEHFYAHKLKGQLYYNNNDYDLALDELNKAIELCDSDVDTYYFRILCNHTLNNHNNVIDDSTKILEFNSFNIDVYYLRGNSYFEIDDLENALSDMNHYLDNKNTNEAAYNIRAMCFFHTNKYDLALKDIEKAIELNPNISAYYIIKASILNKLNLLNDALIVLYDSIKLHPSEILLYNIAINNHILLKEYDKAISIAKKAIEIDNASAEAYKNYAHILYKLGNTSFARENIKKAIEINPDNGDFYIVSAAINLSENKFDECFNALNIAKRKTIHHYDYLDDCIFDKIKDSSTFLDLYN